MVKETMSKYEMEERLTDVLFNLRGVAEILRAMHEAMENTKITIALPRSVIQAEVAGDIETLTQRYWESMLSRMVMVGHAPKELVDLVGYNPVIELEKKNPIGQIEDILAHIEDYQPLVDRNRDTALQIGDWTLRMKKVIEWLDSCEYKV